MTNHIDFSPLLHIFLETNVLLVKPCTGKHVMFGYVSFEMEKSRMEEDQGYISITYCWNSTLINGAEGSAMVPNAGVARTMVAPSDEGLDLDVCARSTILTWTIWSGRQVLGTAALIHLTKYCLPQAAPLSHIPSPAAANMLLDGNCDDEFP